MLDRLQRRREEGHLRQLQQRDPYEQYMSANQAYPHPQQQYQYTPHPSVPGSVVHGGMQPQLPQNVHAPTAQPSLMNVNPSHRSVPGSVAHRGEGVQPQLSPSVHVPTAQPSLRNFNPSREQHLAQQERQSLQQSDPRRSVPHSLMPTVQTSSTRVSSDVLSYATPPEARRPPLSNNNSSRPQNQDYFNSQHPASGIPLQTLPSTQGSVSIPAANYTPRLPSTTNSAQAAHVHGFSNEPPGYSTEMINNVQRNAASTTPYREKH